MRARPQPFTVLVPLTLLCAPWLGCARPEVAPDVAVMTALEDPELVRFDAAAPEYDFAGSGSILLGDGWGRAEQSGRPKAWFAWMLDGRTTIEVPPPVRRADEPVGFDFVAEAMPFSFEGRPEQRLSLWHAERVLGDVVLDDDWATVRIPLPDDLAMTSPFVMTLRASHVQQPSALGRGSADTRGLSVAFRRLAVVPRGLADGRVVHSTRQEAGVVIPSGGAVAIPLPSVRRVTVALDGFRTDSGDCQFDVRYARAVGEESALWTGPRSAAPMSVSVETLTGALGFLTVGWWPARGQSRCSPLTVSLASLLGMTTGSPDTDQDAEALAPPPVFVYLIDTLRADALVPFGGDPDVSPNARDFAADAVTYRQAWSPSAWTLPATLSVLTGVYPDRHGVMTGRVAFDAAAVPTLAARLAARGYATAGFSQSLVASPRFGIDAGFEHFELQDQLNGAQNGSPRLRRRMLRWLAGRAADDGRPVFAYLHSVDPHAPYVPIGDDRRFAERVGRTLNAKRYHPITFHREGLGGDPRDVAHLRGLYEGEVAFTDRQLGRFVRMLRHLGLYERAMVIVLSDHGEEFGEHGGFGHGRTLYEEQLRVPLMIKFPGGQWAGQVIDRPVSTVDVVPTVLAVAAGSGDRVHADGGAGFDGRSLLPPDLVIPEPRPLLGLVAPDPAEGFAGVDYRAFRLGGVKCIESRGATDQFGQPVPTWQVFDLTADPDEQTPLASTDRRAERCQRLLARWMTQREETADAPSTGDAIDPETLEQLKALGYLGG